MATSAAPEPVSGNAFALFSLQARQAKLKRISHFLV